MEERNSSGGEAGGREGRGGGGGGGEPSSSRVRLSCVKLGGRQIFMVDLRPGETTFVSWKKLMKDANKVNSGSTPAPVPPPANAHPSLESRIPPGQPTEKEVNDTTPPNRFNAVIEKIERLYKGKDISDEEDLMDVPDDDQYDTEDSFIDDAELDEYFEVDDAAIKHDGFFVNRGKLEQIESTVVPNKQPKKRRIKDASKAPGKSDDGRLSNKHAKRELQDTAKPKAGVLQSKSLTEKLKDASGLSDGSHQRYLDKTAHPQTKMQSAKSMCSVDEHDLSVHSKEKNGVCELPDLNIPEAKNPMQEAKTSHTHKKDGSMVRPKSSMLEKAIRELEKMVVESRPPTWDNQEADTCSQAIKRRLPTEIKLKLAKVARLAVVTLTETVAYSFVLCFFGC
uniref:Ubinuclein-1-like isoform X5 n=1 Tax=Rhizophora mucronata TaxID=61149 RepID=A0A2P2MCY8_RHIMU